MAPGAGNDGRPKFTTKEPDGDDFPENIFLEKKDMRGEDEIDVEEMSLKKFVRGISKAPCGDLDDVHIKSGVFTSSLTKISA